MRIFQLQKKIKAVLIVKSKEYENCLDSLVDNKSWQIRNVLVEAKNYELCYGTIHTLRQKKDWVGGFGKRPLLLTFSTVAYYCIFAVLEGE